MKFLSLILLSIAIAFASAQNSLPEEEIVMKWIGSCPKNQHTGSIACTLKGGSELIDTQVDQQQGAVTQVTNRIGPQAQANITFTIGSSGNSSSAHLGFGARYIFTDVIETSSTHLVVDGEFGGYDWSLHEMGYITRGEGAFANAKGPYVAICHPIHDPSETYYNIVCWTTYRICTTGLGRCSN